VIYIVTGLVALSAALLVAALSTWVSEDGRILRRQLAQLQIPKSTPDRLRERRARRKIGRRARVMMEALGARVALGPRARDTVQTALQHAGFRGTGAVHVFLSLRVILALGFGTCAVFLLTSFEAGAPMWVPVIALFALVGWALPFLLVKRRARARQLAIQRAIPDMLDLLVVCVEAGLGLNQALYRVAQEIDAVSPDLAEELAITNLEIRAGTPRTDALRGLADRTGLEDMRSLTGMLVQTDRFGTSIAKALRVHADTLRTKRRQRAEEQAAKTSIKMIFPLAIFVFPAIFVVLLGPALFLLREALGGL